MASLHLEPKQANPNKDTLQEVDSEEMNSTKHDNQADFELKRQGSVILSEGNTVFLIETDLGSFFHDSTPRTTDTEGRLGTPLRREKALVITSPDLDMIQEATERESSSGRSSIVSGWRIFFFQ